MSKCLAAFTPMNDPDGSLVPFINISEDAGFVTVRVRSQGGVNGIESQAAIVLSLAEWVALITDAVLNGSQQMNLMLLESSLSRIKVANPA